MKTNSKKYIVLSLISIAVCFPLLVLIFIIYSQTNKNTPIENTLVPQSFPTSYTSTSEIDVNTSSNVIFYNYSIITDDDFILLKNDSKELYVNLEKKNWKNIKFSKEGNLVAVLGESRKDLYDIHIYNIENKSWIQATDYKNINTGVEDFVWTDNSTIYFIQGEDSDKWIHSYNYVSGEIIKEKKVFDSFSSTNQNPENIVIDNIDKFTIYDKNLEFITDISKSQKNGELEKLFEVLYADFGNKFYLANSNEYYEYQLNTQDNKFSIREYNFQPLCQSNNTFIIGITQKGRNTIVYQLNQSTSEISILSESITNLTFENSILVNKVKCINDKIYFFIDNSVYGVIKNNFSFIKPLAMVKDFDIYE